METYTITAAAELLSTTRQTIYNHIRKDPDGLTVKTDDDKRLITLQGLAILKERLKGKPGPVQIDRADTGHNQTVFKAEMIRLQQLVNDQAADVERLTSKVQELTALIDELRKDKAYLQATLDKALEKTPLWERLFGKRRPRLTSGKVD